MATNSDKPRWVILGFGEAAAALVSAGLLDGGPVAVCLPLDRAPSAATQARLAERGITASRNPRSVHGAAVVLSLVTPEAAQAVAEAVVPHLSPGTLYVDLNAIAGQTAAAIAHLVEARGARFIDAAVMGPVPLMGLRVPIWLSGDAAEEFHRQASARGLATTVISSRPGDASSLKMLWSVMTKGTIALLAESLTAAHRLGLLDPLLGLIAREYGNTGTRAMVMRMLRSTAASGDRRIDEMGEVARTLEGAGVPAWTVEATVRWIAALNGMAGVAETETVPEVVQAVSDGLTALLEPGKAPSP